MRPTVLPLLFVLSITAPGEDPRRVEVLADGWRFHRGDVEAAGAASFDAGEWEAVRVPHTWNAQDGQDGGNDYHRGPGWYRRELAIPAGGARRHFLRFNAASLVADVYLDGQHLGQHRGGFSAFCFELTPHVTPGGTHQLAVRVDNTRVDDVAPLSGDFTVCGGLYRPVELLTTAATCISPLDHASPGVYIATDNLNDLRGEVAVRTLLSNAGDARELTLVTEALDADGQSVAKVQRAEAVAGGESEVVRTLRINRPHRWDGRRDPYLYTVRVELRDGEAVLDRVEQPLGLREFRLDPDEGFFLNGRRLDLHGVSRHQDRADKGWAISAADITADFDIMTELGCTIVRLAHYQHAVQDHQEADRRGLVIWAEIPLVDKVTDSDAFRENIRQQLRELIRQNYNHPSICFWGIHNEVTAPWKQPSPDPAATVKMLHALAKEEDPARLTVLAATDPEDHPANWAADATSFNRYFGWYWGDAAGFAEWADKMHAAHPDVPLGVSEYGGGGSIRHHEAWPPKLPKHNGPWHPEEWQAYVHEVHWNAMKERPFLWSNILWNGFDFASDGRKEGDAEGINDKGLVTHDREVRKDAWYWYQANWTGQPMVHITSTRWTPRPAGPALVRVYSNCGEVELFLGDESLGVRPVSDCVAAWPEVPLGNGGNRLRAVGRHAEGQVEDVALVVGE